MTADVDVTVDLGRMRTLAFLETLTEAGFDLRADLGEDFLREARLLPLVHRSTTMPLDVIIAGTSLHAEILARRRLVDIGGLRVPMMSPEDLVVTKVLAGRPKDFDDVRGVLLEQPSLDLDQIRELLGELEASLDDHRFVRRFERMVRDTRRAVDATRPRSRR